MSEHLKGLLITIFGVLILSPDSLFIRLANTNSWTMLFWRGLLFTLGIVLIILIIYRSTILHQFIKMGKTGFFIGVMMGISTTFFVIAIQETSIANALVIISTSSIFSALLSRFFLNEKTQLRTWITIFIIIGAMILIMSDSYQSGGIWGDISALMVAIIIATNFTITHQKKNINMVPAMAIGGLVTAIIAGIVIFFSSTIPLHLTANAIPYILANGIVTTLAFALIMIGPRYISPAEVSMIMQLEIVFGTFLGWIYLNETPSIYAVAGGLIIITTLIIHSWLSLKANFQEKVQAKSCK